ncbi:TerB family tellurite resistance protein [Roseospira marina]|uniref:TerB family tellurite resistance protein n=1 Tax=Roseospira marina TaxID=140057 RepID=A0A5M6IF22_9PROT|nr:TerB family tellurite resistance protein [Roseospira marina]KAA5606732.1 TerB family tellurite resistance protein [Roseospira marina]MBB4313851.1 putative tellurite resistance protein B-like protein [Roseospira marina]MBB5087013.1 putative tellurite resistance protein B-like protein [Roseospira marina]
MLHALRNILFGDEQGDETKPKRDEVQFAAALLLTEAAMMDGAVDEDEHARIRDLLQKRFGLARVDAEALYKEARETNTERVDLYGPSRVLKDAFEYDQRIELLEMLWDVVYADGLVHEYEANLMRRLTGLLYVDDQDSGAARKRVLERRGLA